MPSKVVILDRSIPARVRERSSSEIVYSRLQVGKVGKVINIPSVNQIIAVMVSRDPKHWLELINSAPAEDKVETYEKASKLWPGSSELWLEYVKSVESAEEKGKLLARALPQSVDWKLYNEYIEHIRTSSPDNLGNAYEYALGIVSFDPNSGNIWKSYIDWLGVQPVSNDWEEQFRRDRVRKAFKRAVTIPLTNIEQLWRSYSNFENRISRVSARKFIDERSGTYMKARSALKTWQTVSKGSHFGTLPSEQESENDTPTWRRLIEWERSNPLELDEENLTKRIEFIFKHATQCARWSALLWFDAGLYCNAEFWELGSQAMPESLLSAFKSAENFEILGQYDDVKRVLMRLCDSLKDIEEDPTPALAELVRCTHRLLGLDAARKCIVETLESIETPGYSLYVVAASLERKEPTKEQAVWSLAYRKFGRTSPEFLISYLDYSFLHEDIVNARAVFEQTADLKFRKVWDRMLELESKHVQSASTSVKALKSLESRYIETFKDIDEVQLFIQRYGAVTTMLPKQIKSSAATEETVVVESGAISQLLSALPPANVYDGPTINNNLSIQSIMNSN